MPAHANEAPSNSIANAAAGAEQSSRLNIHPLPVLLGSLAETLPTTGAAFLNSSLAQTALMPKPPSAGRTSPVN